MARAGQQKSEFWTDSLSRTRSSERTARTHHYSNDVVSHRLAIIRCSLQTRSDERQRETPSDDSLGDVSSRRRHPVARMVAFRRRSAPSLALNNPRGELCAKSALFLVNLGSSGQAKRRHCLVEHRGGRTTPNDPAGTGCVTHCVITLPSLPVSSRLVSCRSETLKRQRTCLKPA